MKQELKAKKESVEVLVRDMEAQAQDLAGVYEGVQRGMEVLETVPVDIERLREQVDALRREVAEKRAGTSTMTEEQRRERDDPRMNMSLGATRQALAEQTSHTKEIEGQIAALQRELPGKMERMEAVDRELAELDRRRNESARLAGEERKRKEMGGRDEVEELARWYRSQEVVFRGLGLGVEG
jgi:chromosome segregation ATPase